MGITVIGGVLAMVMIRGFTDPGSGGVANLTVKERIELTGYDTRDGGDLTGITVLDNYLNTPAKLCTTSCSTSPNAMPGANGGTDFIVIYLRNAGQADVYLEDIIVSTDNINHDWDGDTNGGPFNPGTNHPDAGEYTILPETGTSSVNKHTSTIIHGTEYVRVVIKLSQNITPDIDVGDTIPIIVTTTEGSTFQFNIEGGSVL